MIRQTVRTTADIPTFQDNALEQQLAIQFVGGTTWTVQFEASLDGVTWNPASVASMGGGAGDSFNNASGPPFWIALINLQDFGHNPGLHGFKFRARFTAVASPLDVLFQPVAD